MDTIFPADTVEFCPHRSNILVCGTYKLLENETLAGSQKRIGQCLVFRTSTNADGDSILDKVSEVNLPAVLDTKWSHKPSDTPLLAVADSEGKVTIHEWHDDESQLKQIQSVPCDPGLDPLCLSLDWSNRKYPACGPDALVASLSNGSLCILRSDASSQLAVVNTWHAHDHEPWAAAWNAWNPNIVYSGGDDLKMKAWDLRTDPTQPIFTNKRFEAGVTSIQSHPNMEHVLAVGSYDNTVRIFDLRKPAIPVTAVDVGGGAWRVKWHPSAARKADLLVACMHDGFKVLHFDECGVAGESLSNGSVTVRFDEHQSLAYGVDWSLAESMTTSLIASCSFYDHTLHLWRG